MEHKLITIEGNIGAGKTTLSTILAARLNARLVLEQFSDNPFLPKFYTDPAKYAFPLELFFMAERFKQLKELTQPDMFQQVTVSDYLFVKCLLFAKVNLPAEEYQLYKKLFDIIHQQMRFPDILIFLQAPVEKLQENIRKRGRDYEQNISDSYLQEIQDAYLSYIQWQTGITLIVDVTNADFMRNEMHVQTILNALETHFPPGIHRITLPS